ncbi:MAG: sigma-70 family RNA polymerase sigma factor [Thermoguttaceae bacterium]
MIPEQDAVFGNPSEDFLRLFSEHSREIYVHIFRLVLNQHDADDIFQESNLVLWREFESFQKGTHFRAWAYKIATNQVLAWRKRQKRNRLIFSEEFICRVAERLSDRPAIEERMNVLQECIFRLPKKHQELIRDRYEHHLDIETIANKKGRSANAIYRALNRIRRSLFECTQKKIIAK